MQKKTYVRKIVTNGWGNLDTLTMGPVGAHFTLEHQSRLNIG